MTFIKKKEGYFSIKSISLRFKKRENMQLKKVLVICCVGTLFIASACKRETKDEKFRREFQQFTQKECPKEMDPYTRMDSICYDIETRTLTEYYSVRDTLDHEDIYTEELVSNFHDEILKGLKSSIHFKQYKDEGITFRYDYRSITSGKLLLRLTYTKEDYGK